MSGRSSGSIECPLEGECFAHVRDVRRCRAWMLGLVAVFLLGAGPEESPRSSPERLHSAPSSATLHRSVARYQLGAGAESYWLFEPDSPKPMRAPVIVFLHGWMYVNPGVYGAWIDHLVRNGSIVIFPRFQADWKTLPGEFAPNALSAVRDALGVLRSAPGHVRPDERRFALVGHSVGGDLAVHLSGKNRRDGLPDPRTLIVLLPGRLDTVHKPDPGSIPAETLLVVAVADQDQVVGDDLAREIFEGAVRIPRERKRYVVYRSDLHGHPPLIADHMMPTASHPQFDTGEGPLYRVQMAQAQLNDLDRLGLWRMADLALAAGFTDRSFDDIIPQGNPMIDLGRWTDGHPVVPPLVSANPLEFPRLPPSLNARFLLNPGRSLSAPPLRERTLASPSNGSISREPREGFDRRLSAGVSP